MRLERFGKGRGFLTALRIGVLSNKSSGDAPNLLRLLRTHSERPCAGRTGNDFDEIAASHRLPQGLGPRVITAGICDW